MQTSEIRTMLFGLNVKLPFLLEQREQLDAQIRQVEFEIRSLRAQITQANGDVTDVLVVKNRRGRPPRALIEAASGEPVMKPQRYMSPVGREAIRQAQIRRREREKTKKAGMPEETREKLRKAQRKRWASMSPRVRKQTLAMLMASRDAARRANV